jgi:hypothetical protein
MYFLKNPIVLIVLGILLIPMGIGIIMLIIGIVVLNKEKKAIAANLPFYLEIVDALKKSGYEVDEFERKGDRVRTNIYLNGNWLGEVFLVPPPPSGRYAQFRRIEDMTKKDFKYNYSRKFGKSPSIPSSYWPDNSLVGASIEWSAENCSEKGKWLSDMADIFEKKLSKGNA